MCQEFDCSDVKIVTNKMSNDRESLLIIIPECFNLQAQNQPGRLTFEFFLETPGL